MLRVADTPVLSSSDPPGTRSTVSGSSRSIPRSSRIFQRTLTGRTAYGSPSRRRLARAASATQPSYAPAGTVVASELPPRGPAERWLLHFGAVDYSASVWVNGVCLGKHEGGYTPFTFDITDLLTGATCEIVVRADDDPHDLTKPRGKQDWQLEPHSIWYPRTSGIWQTVWLERVPATRIGRIAYTPDLTRWEIGIEVWIGGEDRARASTRRETPQRSSRAGGRHVSGRQRRGPSRHRAVGSGHRRLTERAALEPAFTKSHRCAAGTVGRARRANR